MRASPDRDNATAASEIRADRPAKRGYAYIRFFNKLNVVHEGGRAGGGGRGHEHVGLVCVRAQWSRKAPAPTPTRALGKKNFVYNIAHVQRTSPREQTCDGYRGYETIFLYAWDTRDATVWRGRFIGCLCSFDLYRGVSMSKRDRSKSIDRRRAGRGLGRRKKANVRQKNPRDCSRIYRRRRRLDFERGVSGARARARSVHG